MRLSLNARLVGTSIGLLAAGLGLGLLGAGVAASLLIPTKPAAPRAK